VGIWDPDCYFRAGRLERNLIPGTLCMAPVSNPVPVRSVEDPDPGLGIRCFFYPPDSGSGMEQWSDPGPDPG
jgi:hypothetical protein